MGGRARTAAAVAKRPAPAGRGTGTVVAEGGPASESFRIAGERRVAARPCRPYSCEDLEARATSRVAEIPHWQAGAAGRRRRGERRQRRQQGT